MAYIDFIFISLVKKRYIYPVSSLLSKYSKEDSGRLTNHRVMEYLSQKSHFSRIPNFIKMIANMKNQFRGSSTASMDFSLSRIVNIDFHHSNMGLSYLSNRILDEDERSRFLLYSEKSINIPLARLFLFSMLGCGLVQWALHAFVNKSQWPGAFDTISPYFCLLMVAVLIVLRFKQNRLQQVYIGRWVLIQGAW
jgi:hypothetical protein